MSVKHGEIFPGFEVGEADTVLDVGCGTGWACVAAGRLGADVIALDVDTHALETLSQAMRQVPARSFRAVATPAEALPWPLPDQVASIVIATEVLEHLDDPRRVLAELARVGRPGARYLISVPDPASEHIFKLVAPPYNFQKPYHQHIFERKQLDLLIQDAGLRVESRLSHGSYWAFWWILRMAVGSEHLPGQADPPPILADWQRLWEALTATPRGASVARALDGVIPKSQVVFARKPVSRPRGVRTLGWGWLRRLKAAGAGRRPMTTSSVS